MRNFTHNFAMGANGSSDGFVLLDSDMNPLFVNHEAAQILTYPREPEKHEVLAAHLAGRIRSILVAKQPTKGSVLVSRFQSGRRQYVCHSFKVSDMQTENSKPSVAAILERVSTRPVLANCFDKFNLTAREQEVALLLSQGLTSKEIGARLEISPNTVKAFLRIIMVKMGVSTRSGIVGRAFNAQL